MYVLRIFIHALQVHLKCKFVDAFCALIRCVLEKHSRVEKLPLLTDGVDGLGRCEGSLVDQLWTSNVIQKKILGVCLAKELRQRPSGPLPAGRVGFISLGMDFSSKFDSQNLVWSKLAGPE